MSATIQTIKTHHTPTDSNVPSLLYAGEIATGTGPTFTRMWIGDGTTNRLMFSNNPADTPIFDIAGGGGGGIPEAPTDGQIYGRNGQLADWQPVLPLSGGTMSGNILGLGSSSLSLFNVTATNILTAGGLLDVTGAAMFSNTVTLAGDPTTALEAATKQYVDAHSSPGTVISDTPPASPTPGQLWWNSLNGQLYIWYQDASSSQWVVVVNQAAVAGAITDAPSDGQLYGRESAAWASVNAFIAPTVQAAADNNGRNLIHNGQFNIAQRGQGPWTTDGSYTADRWQLDLTADTVSISIVDLGFGTPTAINDEDAFWCLQNTFAGSAAPAANHFLQQKIERVYRHSGKTVTVSFWAVASAAGMRLGLNIAQYFGTGGNPSPTRLALATGIGFALTTAWARYTATIALPSTNGDTLGTNGDDFTGLQIFYSSGATNNAAAGNIGVQSGTIYLWGVQLELGSVATPLEKRDPQIELQLCSRFYCTGGLHVYGYTLAGSYLSQVVSLPVPMRASPTLVLTPGGGANVGSSSISAPWGLNYQVRYLVQASAAGSVTAPATFTASADL